MQKILRFWMLVLALGIPGMLHSEGLFESAESAALESSALVAETGGTGAKISLNGYFKSAMYLGRNDAADGVLQGAYGELDLKGSLEKSGMGRAWVDVRGAAGENRGPQTEGVPDLREAWLETQTGPMVWRLGRQILVWGRADSINPTNNLTPKNEVALSSEYDDTRMGNELLQATARLLPEVSLTCVWVPRYRPDVMPISLVDLPGSVAIGETAYPDQALASSNWAVRAEVSTGPVDGSLSYYDGYATLPGFNFSLGAAGITLIPTAYRMKAAGGDFSMALGDFGLRGEVCYKQPYLSNVEAPYVPSPYFQYVAGLDRTFGDWNALVQYSGVYVRDFKELDTPVLGDPYDPMAQMQYGTALAAVEMEKLNREFTGTQNQVSHAATAQLGWSGLADTLHVKLAGLYNFTTREFAVNPSVTYDLADAMTITLGGRDIDGPAESLNRLVNRLMSSAYLEAKYSF